MRHRCHWCKRVRNASVMHLRTLQSCEDRWCCSDCPRTVKSVVPVGGTLGDYRVLSRLPCVGTPDDVLVVGESLQ